MLRPLHLGLAASLAASLVCGGRALAIEGVLDARGLGMAGTGISSATGALAPILNPADLTIVRQYTLEGSYAFRIQDLGSSLNLSITDSATNEHVAMGVYYNFIHGSPRLLYNLPAGASAPTTNDITREGHETGLAIAVPLGDHFSFGLTSKYITISTEATNPDANQPMAPKTYVLDSSTSSATADGFTIDIGLALLLGQAFRIGVVGYDLIPLHSLEAPLAMGVGISYVVGQALLIGADLRIDFDKYKDVAGDRATTVRVSAGGEYVIRQAVPIRLGFAYDSGVPGGAYLAAGIGFLSPRVGVDVGWQNKVSHGNETILSAGIRVFLQ